MAEQYLINDTTLTSIADAIRVVTGSYYGRQTIANVYDYWMDVMLPSEMPRAISGIVGLTDMPSVVGRSSINDSCITINGMSELRSCAFAVSRYASESNPYESVNTIVLHGIRTMHNSVFYGWDNLESMFVLDTTVPSLDDYALSMYYSTIDYYIYVWSSMYDQFLNDSVWGPYSKYIYSVRNISELGIRLTSDLYHIPGSPTMYSELEHGQYLIYDTTLTSIASAIRGQLGISTEYLPREMSTAILSAGSPTDSTLLSIANGTITSFSDGQSSVTEVGDYAFAYCSDLSSVHIPACKTIRREAFRSDFALASVSCSNVEYIGSMAFYQCSALKSMSCSKCTEIDNNAFYTCRGLSTVSFPSCTNLGTYAFATCEVLSSVSMPRLQSVGGSAFRSCIVLSTLSLPSCTYIGRGAFEHCESLKSLYLMGSSVVSLAHSNAFSYSPMLSSGYLNGYGSIYVPTSLYNSYYNASYWSNLRARLVAL